ncbi:MAG TPA: helix-turn-helix transcriptional regulator [Actinospica sp.]|jgi:DNA-binding CsgD family transcriptional regulator|nr:helix-turn-helix transcriptional regulator [Actinospica sp.]
MDDPNLTPREAEVLDLFREGHSSKEIARALGITRATVRCHVQSVLTKLGVPTRRQAAALIPSPPQATAAPPTAISTLTPRETQVLHCIAAGIGRTEIARHLFMSPHTARTHIQRILAKLDLHSALAAMALARRLGLPPPPEQPT